ncbi:MAG: hypothetical protein WC565_07040 [Parcubacteria group bacterium]
MATDTEKLSQIVEFLAQVRTILDGGWHYSSPLIRHESNETRVMLVERPDALGIVADVVTDLASVSSVLFTLEERAKELNVDTVVLCQADLGLLARTYQLLAQEISNAANRAIDTLTVTAPKAERKRAPRTPKASPSSSPTHQTSLLEQDEPTSEGVQS